MNSTAKQQFAVRSRWVIRRDLTEILTIERASFDSPWSEDDFLRTLRHRQVIGRVAESAGGDLAGFVVYELQPGEIEILNLAVHPVDRRGGVGALLLAKLVEQARRYNRPHLTALVRESNLTAQLFFRAQGFRATEILRDYYPGTGEDAYRMERWLPAVGHHELGGES